MTGFHMNPWLMKAATVKTIGQLQIDVKGTLYFSYKINSATYCDQLESDRLKNALSMNTAKIADAIYLTFG